MFSTERLPKGHAAQVHQSPRRSEPIESEIMLVEECERIIVWFRRGGAWVEIALPDQSAVARLFGPCQVSGSFQGVEWWLRQDRRGGLLAGDDDGLECRCCVCGCSEDDPCEGGCHWTSEDEQMLDRCSSCVGLSAVLE